MWAYQVSLYHAQTRSVRQLMGTSSSLFHNTLLWIERCLNGQLGPGTRYTFRNTHDTYTNNLPTILRTLQEELLSRRMLQFTESQVEFSCLLGSVWEGMDTTTAFKDYRPKHPTQLLAHTITRAPSVSMGNHYSDKI